MAFELRWTFKGHDFLEEEGESHDIIDEMPGNTKGINRAYVSELDGT